MAAWSVCTARCTSPTTRHTTRSSISRPAIWVSARSTRAWDASARWSAGTNGIPKALVSPPCKVPLSCSIPRRSAGIRPRRRPTGRSSSTPGAPFSAATRSRTAATSRRWTGWPHNKSDWPGRFGPIPWVYTEIVRKLAPAEMVRILVNSSAHEGTARRALTSAGVSVDRVEFFRFPTNRGWTRDFGALFARRSGSSGELAIARFRFNAWAKYPDWKKDDRIPERVAARLKVPLVRARAGSRDVVLEGGSIEVNGRGSLLTTEECLLDPAVQVRNPGLSRSGLEAVLRDYLGATNVLWLGRGIAGDDTHGHVADVCRFVNPG